MTPQIIRKVEYVKGQSLQSYWKCPMQKIYIEGIDGFFIDTLPIDFNFKKISHLTSKEQISICKDKKRFQGTDWSKFINQTIDLIIPEEKSYGYLWLINYDSLIKSNSDNDLNNKDIFYTIDKKQKGPVSFEQLKNIKLDSASLIWYEGLSKWQSIEQIPDLNNVLKLEEKPPPLPNINNDTPSSALHTSKQIKSSNKTFKNYLIWLAFHLFAIVTSYSGINFFNRGKPKSDEFWPFVKVFKFNEIPTVWHGSIETFPTETSWSFNGLFYKYDWPEFIIFVGGATFILLISKISSTD